MDREIFAAEDFFAALDQLGEIEVRRMLDADAYTPAQQPFVREWLMRRDEERGRREAESDRDS